MQTLILKMTKGCNLDCAYCSVEDKTSQLMMDVNTATKAIGWAAEHCDGKISILFHGGEPMLYPIEQYVRIIECSCKTFPHIEFHWKMQSNGTLISDKWIDFFKTYNVSIGISLDGPQSAHDKFRVDKLGKGTSYLVKSNIERLVKADVRISTLMVLTSCTDKSDFSFLDWYNEHGVFLKVNPMLVCGEALNVGMSPLEPGEYGRYIISLFMYLVEKNLEIVVEPINAIVKGIFSGTNVTECTFSPNCLKDFLCVDPLGDVYPCGRFCDNCTYMLGNINNDFIYPDNNLELNRLLVRKTSSLPNDCKICKYKLFCNSGCTAEAGFTGDSTAKSVFCEDYKMLFDYFTSSGLDILEKKLYGRKEQLMALKGEENGNV